MKLLPAVAVKFLRFGAKVKLCLRHSEAALFGRSEVFALRRKSEVVPAAQ